MQKDLLLDLKRDIMYLFTFWLEQFFVKNWFKQNGLTMFLEHMEIKIPFSLNVTLISFWKANSSFEKQNHSHFFCKSSNSGMVMTGRGIIWYLGLIVWGIIGPYWFYLDLSSPQYDSLKNGNIRRAPLSQKSHLKLKAAVNIYQICIGTVTVGAIPISKYDT